MAINAAFSPTIRQDTTPANMTDAQAAQYYAGQAYANGSTPSYGQVGANGIMDAYGTAWGSPDRYKYYQKQLGDYTQKYYTDNPGIADWANSNTAQSAQAGGVQTGAPADYVDPLQSWLATLTPSQRSEYNSVSNANYNKGSSTNQGAFMAALAAMTAGGALAANSAVGGADAATSAAWGNGAGLGQDTLQNMGLNAATGAGAGGNIPTALSALPGASGGSQLAANAGTMAGNMATNTLPQLADTGLTQAPALSAFNSQAMTPLTMTDMFGNPALESALNSATYTSPWADSASTMDAMSGNLGAAGASAAGAASPWTDFLKQAGKALTTGTGANNSNSPLSSLLSLVTGYQQGNKGASQYNDVINQINGLYSPDSPYAQQMKQAMERKDAAAGRNSQYGDRAVQLAAALTNSKAQALTSAGYTQDLASRINQQNQGPAGLNAAFQNTGVNNLITQAGAGVGNLLSNYFSSSGTPVNNTSTITAPNANSGNGNWWDVGNTSDWYQP